MVVVRLKLDELAEEIEDDFVVRWVVDERPLVRRTGVEAGLEGDRTCKGE